MSRYLFKGVVACLLAILLTAFTVVPVMAADLRGGENITIASGEVVNGDLCAAGADITINGTVNGDVWAAGRTITINGTVNGAVIAAAQTITLNGPITRSARVAGQTIIANSSIKTDLVAFATTLDITSKAQIGGDLVLGCNTVQLAGHVDGSVKGGGGNVTISGNINGNVEIRVETLTIASTAAIQGNLDYTSENEARIQSGAKIGGKVTQKLPEPKDGKRDGAIFPWLVAAGVAIVILWKVLSFLMALVMGIILLFIVRRRMVSLADAIKTNPLSSLGWGALILFVTPIAAIIVCVTVIGLPLGLITLVLYGIVIYLSQIPVALCLGRLILGRVREVESGGMLVGTLATGLAILAIMGCIPVIGFLVGLATALFGLGSLVASQIKLRAEPR